MWQYKGGKRGASVRHIALAAAPPNQPADDPPDLNARGRGLGTRLDALNMHALASCNPAVLLSQVEHNALEPGRLEHAVVEGKACFHRALVLLLVEIVGTRLCLLDDLHLNVIRNGSGRSQWGRIHLDNRRGQHLREACQGQRERRVIRTLPNDRKLLIDVGWVGEGRPSDRNARWTDGC